MVGASNNSTSESRGCCLPLLRDTPLGGFRRHGPMLARQDRESVEFGGLGTDLYQQALDAGESVVGGVGHHRRRIAAFARRALSQIDTGCQVMTIEQMLPPVVECNRRGPTMRTNAQAFNVSFAGVPFR